MAMRGGRLRGKGGGGGGGGCLIIIIAGAALLLGMGTAIAMIIH